MKEKKGKEIHLKMCVGSLNHCRSFGVFNILNNMVKISYIFLICKEITSICQ
jgi:hypothetical protein